MTIGRRARALPLGPERLSVIAAFALHAVVAGTLGPRLPAIKAQAGLSASALGTALVCFAAGLFAGTRLAARPVHRFGSRVVLRAAMPILGLSLLAPALARDLVTASIGLLVLGLASGFIDVAMNANAVAVEREIGRPIMSGIHGAWSAGLLAASGGAAIAAALDTSALEHFTIVAALVVVGGVPLLRGLVEKSREWGIAADDGARGAAEHLASRRRALTRRRVLPLGVVGFASFLGEGAIGDWSAVYLHERLTTDTATAALGFAGLAVGMTSSRFAGDALVARFGPVAVVRAGGLLAAIALVLGLLVTEPWAAIAGFTVLGAGLAPVVPITFSAAGNVSGGSGATELGWVVTISYVGGIAGPALIGFGAQIVGLRIALALPAVLALVIAAAAGSVAPARPVVLDTARPPTEGRW